MSGGERNQEPEGGHARQPGQENGFWSSVAILLAIAGVLFLTALVLGVVLANRSQRKTALDTLSLTPTLTSTSTITPTLTPSIVPSPTPTSIFCTPGPTPCPLEDLLLPDFPVPLPSEVDGLTSESPSSPRGESPADRSAVPLAPITPPICGGTPHP